MDDFFFMDDELDMAELLDANKREELDKEIRKRVPGHIADKIIIITVGGKSND